MLRLLADENFNGAVISGLRLKAPHLDLVRMQDEGLRGADDPAILEWAARENRIVLTHDKKTFFDFAYARLAQSLPMPGVIVFKDREAIGETIETIMMLDECSSPDEWNERVVMLPW
jgi:predicted nuclease of predicted toxin-antitoxin system